jgi:alkyl sulfatase BDS1-like metallo-beta-lactamase superfamily hydrolase
MQKILAATLVAVATMVGTAAAIAQEAGPLNSPVRSQDPAVFNSEEVLSHLAPAIWEGENLAYTEEAPTIHPAQTAYARMMPRTIQEIVEGRLYHAFGFQLASTLIAVGDDGLILIDPGSDDDSARDTKAAFDEAVPDAADLPVVAVIYSHRHPDHAFGSAGWGVTQEDIDAGKVQIIASENLVENLVNDVGVVGNILTQRTAYAAGLVPPGPEGPVHFGIGPAFGAGPISFFLPTVEVSASEPLRTTISGIAMEIFHAYGDAGTDEIDVYFPEQRHVHGSETVQGETFPNLYTLRGTSYRDVAKWMEGVGALLEYARNADSYSGSHMRAWMGNDFIVERIQNYRDAIQYVHDQTIYWMNLGYKRDQLAELVVLPEPYASDPWLQEYYGTVAHSVRNIYDGYLGWWEADATQLARPGFIELSRQYVEAMGGRDAVLEKGQAAVKDENYGWAAEILTHLTRADPTDAEARNLKAEALRQWAYLQTNIYWRAFGISGSKELDGTLDRSKPWNFADPAIVKVLPTNQILRTMSVRLNAENAAGETVSAQFEVTDTGEKSGYHVRNQIAAFTEGAMDDADVTLRGPKQAILQTIATGEIADGVDLSGDRASAERFLGLFDVISPNDVNLLLPPGASLQLDGK